MYAYGYGFGFVGNIDSFDETALDYFTRAGITDITEKNAVNNLLLTIKSDSVIWDAVKNGIGWLISPTSYGASLHNAFNSNFLLNGGVAPSYSSNNGLNFNGINQYLQTGFIFSTHVTAQHKYSTILINKKSGVAVSGDIFSAFNSSSKQFSIIPNSASNSTALADNDSAAILTGVNGNSHGKFQFNCYGDGTREIIRNGVSKASTAVAGGGTLPTVEAYLGARNNNGTGATRFYESEIISFIQTTKELTLVQSTFLKDALVTYNDNVISGGRN